MIVTARQLDDLHRSNGANGHVTLPFRARLTPLAQDWLRHRNVKVAYADHDSPATLPGAAAASAPTKGSAPTPAAASPVSASSSALAASSQAPCAAAGSSLWWCDGPCGPAKAALMAQALESSIAELAVANDPNHLLDAIKTLARAISSGAASTGVLMVRQGATAVVFANRCPSLRAILGTCLESVDQGVQQLAANVLVIEHPHKTLAQVKNLLARFLRHAGGAGARQPTEVVKHQLQELSSCA